MGERLKLFYLLIFFVYFVIFVVQLQFLGSCHWPVCRK